MNQATSGVLVSENQHSETGRQSFDNLVSLVSRGEVEGQIIEGSETPHGGPGEVQLIRRGVMRGAMVGFAFGLVPLMIWTIMAAAAGGLIAKATLLRLERGSAPRLRFARFGEE